MADAQDDRDVVRREYTDETGLCARSSLWARRTGPRAIDVTFDEVLARSPRRVLEVGCGRGELAERLVEAGLDVVALDQSERMVELTRARGVDARVGDVENLPFDGEFDVAVANFMLYHVPDLDRALTELRRVARILVAATNGFDQLREMWELVGRDLGDRQRLFMRETGEELLRRHFTEVSMIDLPATVELSADDMRHYIAHSVAHRHLAARVPDFEGTRIVTASAAVFVAS
ncbi:MAG TPA: class I SAM-dependent methyltransferase [Gaiellaceae bacterium]|nr:class I SAM-dependent methyltransferase [Gaiellaceae bacterium]